MGTFEVGRVVPNEPRRSGFLVRHSLGVGGTPDIRSIAVVPAGPPISSPHHLHSAPISHLRTSISDSYALSRFLPTRRLRSAAVLLRPRGPPSPAPALGNARRGAPVAPTSAPPPPSMENERMLYTYRVDKPEAAGTFVIAPLQLSPERAEGATYSVYTPPAAANTAPTAKKPSPTQVTAKRAQARSVRHRAPRGRRPDLRPRERPHPARHVARRVRV